VEAPSRRDALIFVIGLTFFGSATSDFITGGILVTPGSIAITLLVPVEPAFICGGLLLVRETVLRWHKGWVSTLLLGGALGLVWEGLFTKVIFGSSNFASVGYLGVYGHWLGVNWVLAALAFVYHGSLTVALPIFLAERLFVRVGTKPLLGGGWLWVWIGSFLAIVTLEYIFIPLPGPPNLAPAPFVSSPPLVDVLLVIVVVAVVSVMAWRIPPAWFLPRAHAPSIGCWNAGALGLAFSGGVLLIGGPGVYVVAWPVVLVGGLVALSLATLFLLRRWLGRERNDAHLAAVAAGALLPYCAIAAVLSVGGDFGAFPVAVLLVALALFVLRRDRRSPGGSRDLGPGGEKSGG
jgi:hypothetical protein